jgi:hypothetical protein
MNCRKEWSSDFRVHFPKSWLQHEYRASREMYLLEEEKTFLPELQPLAEQQRILYKAEEEARRINRALRQNDENEEQLVRIQKETRIQLQLELKRVYHKRYTTLNKKIVPAAKVMMKCPLDCRGFLSQEWQCGLCSTVICKECHAKRDDAHLCKEEEKASVKELEKTTKPCPRCFIRIYKIDGCDQMFCIQCHTAFSWHTGQVESGVIHNPHYFEALRAGQIQDVRHRQEHGGCGMIPRFSLIRSYILSLSHELQHDITNLYQRIVHHRQVTIPRFLQREDNDIHADRISYMIGRLDEDKFKSKVYIRGQRTQRKREEQQIVDSYVTIGEEMFRTINGQNAEEICMQLKALTKITYDAIKNIDMKYQHKGVVGPTHIIPE